MRYIVFAIQIFSLIDISNSGRIISFHTFKTLLLRKQKLNLLAKTSIIEMCHLHVWFTLMAFE